MGRFEKVIATSPSLLVWQSKLLIEVSIYECGRTFGLILKGPIFVPLRLHAIMTIKAIIFDWGRTLFDSTTKKEFTDADDILAWCKDRGYRMACASLVSVHANATLEERRHQIENSPLRGYFEFVEVTDQDKDMILDSLVAKLAVPRNEIAIIDDRTLRGIRYGNKRGHPTIWFQNGKFADEIPTDDTGVPTHTIHSLGELKSIL